MIPHLKPIMLSLLELATPFFWKKETSPAGKNIRRHRLTNRIYW